MESTVRELALLGRHELLDALRRGEFTLPELHAAKINGRLDELMAPVADPPLERVVRDFLRGRPDPRHGTSMKKLLEVAPPGARLAWINDAENLRALVSIYRTEGLAAATERREMSGVGLLLRERFGEARRSELMRGLDLRVPRNGRTRWLTSEEIGRVREAAGKWWVMIGTALATGARRGEIFALRVCDIDFDEGAMVIQQGKSTRARRMIPLHGEMLQILRDWIAEAKLESGDRIFGCFTTSMLRKAWDRIRVEAGVEDARFHDLRHAYAVHCAKAGMPLGELQQRLGHTTITMTMRYAVYQPPIGSTHYARALKDMGLGSPTSTPSAAEQGAVERASKPKHVGSGSPPEAPALETGLGGRQDHVWPPSPPPVPCR